MAKKQKDDELEYLRGLTRKLKSENRHLKKELSRKSKRPIVDEELEQEVQEQLLEEEQTEEQLLHKKLCVKCKSDNIDITDLGIRVLIVCDSCGHREVKKT